MKPQLQAGKEKLMKAYPGKSVGQALQAEKKQDKIAHSLGVKLAALDAGLDVEITDEEAALLDG